MTLDLLKALPKAFMNKATAVRSTRMVLVILYAYKFIMSAAVWRMIVVTRSYAMPAIHSCAYVETLRPDQYLLSCQAYMLWISCLKLNRVIPTLIGSVLPRCVRTAVSGLKTALFWARTDTMKT